MDIRAVIAPGITDKQALEEFIESLNDLAPSIERDIARLKTTLDDRDVIANLFRAAHNIKGDGTLCKVDLAVVIVHPIETVLSRLRNSEITFSEILAEAILLAIDRLELAVEALFSGKSLENLHLVTLVEWLERLAQTPAESVEACAGELIEAVTKAVNVPVICGGGVGCGDDIVDGAKAGADAVACAAVLHYKKETVQELKDEIRAGGVEVRRV